MREMSIHAYALCCGSISAPQLYSRTVFHGTEGTVAPTCSGLLGFSLNRTMGRALHRNPCRRQSPSVRWGCCVENTTLPDHTTGRS